jgi:S-adenosylmethionine:tRNA ribosyltransferase-isomerase
MPAPFTFTLPPELSAKEPPERRGIRRDQVRLLAIDRMTGRIEHTRFDKIAEYLHKNDLLVFNSSRTLPASLRGCECGATHGPCMEVRLAERLPDGSWLALLLCEQGDPFGCGLRAGMKIDFTECDGSGARLPDPAPLEIALLDFRYRTRRSYLSARKTDSL